MGISPHVLPCVGICPRRASGSVRPRRWVRRRSKEPVMQQSIGQVTLVVREYDEALDFYVSALGFTLVEDTYIAEQDRRWVVVAPPGSSASHLLLARAMGEEQVLRIGNQTGRRVFLFLYTDEFWRDYHAYKAKGI